MSEALLPVNDDPSGAQPLDPNVDPAPQVRVEPVVEAAEKPLSRRETIAKALAQKEELSADGATAANLKPKADGRARDPATGRFINKDGSLAAADAGAEAAAQPAQTPLLPSRKPMPKAWKQDYAPKWDALDPEMANFLAEQEEKREKDVLAGVEKYRGLSQYAEGLRDVLAPREQTLQSQYGSVANGIKTLFDISDQAGRDPVNFIHWFAQQRGIDLRRLVQPGPQQQQYDPNAPQGQMPDLTPFIQQAIQPFAQRTAAVEQQLQQFQQQREQSFASQREQSVTSFFSEADASGALKYPLDDDAMEAFSKRVKFLRSDNPDWDDRRVLEKSYEELTWTSDSLRAKRLEADAKRKDQEQKDKAAKDLAAKKNAAVSVKGAPSTSPAGAVDPTNRRAVIERAVSNLQR